MKLINRNFIYSLDVIFKTLLFLNDFLDPSCIFWEI